jgi:hypothetical protein
MEYGGDLKTNWRVCRWKEYNLKSKTKLISFQKKSGHEKLNCGALLLYWSLLWAFSIQFTPVEYLSFQIDQFIAMKKWVAIFGRFFCRKFYKNTAATFSHQTNSKYILPHHFNPFDFSAAHFNLQLPHLSLFPHHKRTNMVSAEN